MLPTASSAISSLIVEDLSTLPHLNRSPKLLQPVVRFSSWITDRHRSITAARQISAYLTVPICFSAPSHMHVGNHGQIGQVKNTLMGLPVTAHQSCPVDGKNHMQFLDTDIMNHLVKRSLQRTKNTPQPPGSHLPPPYRRQRSQRVLLQSPHHKNGSGYIFLKPLQSGPIRHGRRDGHKSRFPGSHLAHDSRKHIRIIGLALLFLRKSRLNIKRFCPVESWPDVSPPADSLFLSLVITWTSHRAVDLLCLLKYSSPSAQILCPSTGPRYLMPRSSKNIPGIIICLIPLLVIRIRSTIRPPYTGILLSVFSRPAFSPV